MDPISDVKNFYKGSVFKVRDLTSKFSYTKVSPHMRVGYCVVVCCCLGYHAYAIDCGNFNERCLALNTDVEVNNISSNNIGWGMVLLFVVSIEQ